MKRNLEDRLLRGVVKDMVRIPLQRPLRSAVRTLILLVIAAFAVRAAVLLTQDLVPSNEGALYLRLAENLRDGIGYLGEFGERHVLFPPLFPLLVAAMSLLASNFELSG